MLCTMTSMPGCGSTCDADAGWHGAPARRVPRSFERCAFGELLHPLPRFTRELLGLRSPRPGAVRESSAPPRAELPAGTAWPPAAIPARTRLRARASLASRSASRWAISRALSRDSTASASSFVSTASRASSDSSSAFTSRSTCGTRASRVGQHIVRQPEPPGDAEPIRTAGNSLDQQVRRREAVGVELQRRIHHARHFTRQFLERAEVRRGDRHRTAPRQRLDHRAT